MKKENPAKLVSAVFCISASTDESAKIDCKGVFTSFLAWSYPTSTRNFHAILTAYGLPKETNTISASIARPRGKKTTIVSADFQGSKNDVGNVFNMLLSYRFPSEGFYNVYFNVVGTTTTLSVPIYIATQPWPKITKSQQKFLAKTPTVPHAIRINVHCVKCSQPYLFEANVLANDKLDKGVLPFPDSGVFECGTCGHSLQLKDIQGQLINSLKTAVEAAMSGGA